MNNLNEGLLQRSLVLSLVVLSIGCGGGKKSGNQSSSGNTILPGAAQLSTPAVTSHTNPAYTNSSPLTIIGSCEAGATVRLGGDSTLTALCNNSGTFTMAISKANNGTYNFTLLQTNLINKPSESLAFQWTKTTTPPAAPTITSPNPNPYKSNGNSITIAGTCLTGSTVTLAGGATGSQACSSNSFSFNVTKSSDANYTFTVRQTDSAGNNSATASVSWLRDTVAPSAPTITNPNSNPHTSADTDLTISGACETGATVNLSGSATDSAACPAGSYSFVVNKTSDATYNFSVSQTDQVGNASSGTAFQWIRSSTVPSTPVLTAPSVSPIYTNLNSLTISGSCEGSNTVELTGSATDSTTCSSDTFSFTVNKSTDATYTFSIAQKNGSNLYSGSAGQVWVRDTVAPSTPTITAPAVSPFSSSANTIAVSGACEINADVTLSGDASGSATCVSGSYSINVTKGSDGSYDFTVAQTDRAGNSSGNASVTWVRDTTAPAPLTRTTPASNPYISNTNSISIGGACENGATVAVSGDSSQSMTCASNAYSFTVNKSTNATFNFSLAQTDAVGNVSSPITFQWTRDTVAPAAPVITNPAATPYKSSSSSITISGTCEAGATVAYSGSVSGTTTCTSGNFSFNDSQSSDGSYTYNVNQTDAANNSSASTSLTWQRDTTAPDAPTITTPALNPYISNGSSVTIGGGCESNATVTLSGNANLTTTCVSSAYSFSVPKSTDSTYNFSISQADDVGNTSNSVSFQWTRDTAAPSAPTLTNPATNPYTSAANAVSVAGACEAGATVNYSGAETGTVSCASGSYTFDTNKTVDGTYNYTITQTDVAGNTSASVAFQWQRLSTIPSTPTITSPAVNPYYSNGSSVTVAGACTTGYLVELSNGATDSMTCASNAYSFNVSKVVDGSYSFTVRQKNPSDIWSAGATTVWVRDTLAPSSPTITSPATNPLTSTANSITISGACENNATVLISGGTTASSTCASSSYSFTVNKSADGTYNFSIGQRDLALNLSGSTAFQWIRDTSVPSAPTITSPSTSPVYSKLGTLAIAGACTTGLTVELSGDGTATTTCASSTYSLQTTKSTDGTYNYTVRQRNVAGTYSSGVNQTWVRDTVAPSAPTITLPTGPVTSNANSITISGACESNATVNINGSATQSTTCSSSSYSMTVPKSSDGVYTFSVSQTDRANNTSGAVNQNWTRDTVAPGTPTLTQPSANPYISGDTNLVVAGACEIGAAVAMTGSSTQNMTCPATGLYSFTVSASTDNTYNYAIRQTDVAGNPSSTLNFQWERDTSIPFTPVMTVPAVNPYHSNGSTITISAICDSSISPQKAVVTLGGDVTSGEVTSPSGELEQECNSSPVTWVVSKSVDGDYTFVTTQENPNNGMVSSDDTKLWVRDTIAPSAPSISTPGASPYTAPGYFSLIGSCEDNATVNLTGDSVQSMTCESGEYNFFISKSVDGTYNFTVRQTDQAGNNSTTVSQQWIRDANSVPAPTITTPATTPFRSNLPSLVLSGACTDDLPVTIGGDVSAGDITSPEGELSQICSGSSYTFVVSKSSDGTYNLNVKHTLNGTDSPIVVRQWIRDTTAPTTTITASPPSTNLSSTANFTFSANETGVTFQCLLDAGSYASCTSPLSYSSMTNASHTFSVRAVDLAGNVGAAATYTWTQAAYLTIGLWHFNNNGNDSGYFTSAAGFNNNLTGTGSPTLYSSGRYPTSSPQSYQLGTGKYFSVADNASQHVNTTTFTMQGFARFTSLPSYPNYVTLVSKSGTSSPNLGFEIRLQRSSSSSSRYRLAFVATSNGTSQTTVTSNNITLSTNTWYHWAVKFNNGTVNFYMSSSATGGAGSKSMGFTTLHIPAETLRIGAGPSSGSGSSQWLSGYIDEVRWSQPARTISFPSTEFTPD